MREDRSTDVSPGLKKTISLPMNLTLASSVSPQGCILDSGSVGIALRRDLQQWRISLTKVDIIRRDVCGVRALGRKDPTPFQTIEEVRRVTHDHNYRPPGPNTDPSLTLDRS